MWDHTQNTLSMEFILSKIRNAKTIMNGHLKYSAFAASLEKRWKPDCNGDCANIFYKHSK